MSLIEKYEANEGQSGLRHIWSAKNEKGGVHIWAVRHKDKRMGERYWGGIEVHSPTPMHEGQDEPHNDPCWLLEGPCYHDGSSLQFSEQIEPVLGHEIGQSDHDYVFSILRSRHAYYFGGGE